MKTKLIWTRNAYLRGARNRARNPKQRPDEIAFSSGDYTRRKSDVVACPKCGERVLFTRLLWNGDHYRICIERRRIK